MQRPEFQVRKRRHQWARLLLFFALLPLAIWLWLPDGGDSHRGQPPRSSQSTNPQESSDYAIPGGPASLFDYSPPKSVPFPSPRFADVHEEVNVHFRYENGAQGDKLAVEQMGGGCAWFDYDHDGYPDLYLIQGGDPTITGNRSRQPPNQLYRNTGQTSFRQVTRQARISDSNYGQGVTVGDYDNDGFQDVYVTNVGPNKLYRNMGDGTFHEITSTARLADSQWSTSAAWADLDSDGDLDLYVCNYAQYDVRDPLLCRDGNQPVMCHPRRLEPAPDRCYWNNGNGTFRQENEIRGLTGPDNRALGIAVADLNQDSAPDIYVANDTTANFLFLNDTTGHFQDQSVAYGCALNTNGQGQASMGVALGDFDQNSLLDLYVTHYAAEYNTLYTHLTPEAFQDVTPSLGLAQPTYPHLGFGTVMADFNRDQRMDLFVANGHVDQNDGLNRPHKMPPQLFSYDHEQQKWWNVSQSAGPFFRQSYIGRGVASADYDADGDLDLCIVHHHTPAAILENTSSSGQWLKLRFIGRSSNRLGIGTRVVAQIGNQTLTHQLPGGTSYCASHAPALILDLGTEEKLGSLTVHWPSGQSQNFENVPLNSKVLIIEPTQQSQGQLHRMNF